MWMRKMLRYSDIFLENNYIIFNEICDQIGSGEGESGSMSGNELFEKRGVSLALLVAVGEEALRRDPDEVATISSIHTITHLPIFFSVILHSFANFFEFINGRRFGRSLEL